MVAQVYIQASQKSQREREEEDESSQPTWEQSDLKTWNYIVKQARGQLQARAIVYLACQALGSITSTGRNCLSVVSIISVGL